MDETTKQFVDKALQSYMEAVAGHEAQVIKMTKDYEDMVEQAARQMDAMRVPPSEPDPVEDVEPPTVAKITAETGEVFYAFNQAAYDQQRIIMDGMLDLIESL